MTITKEQFLDLINRYELKYRGYSLSPKDLPEFIEVLEKREENVLEMIEGMIEREEISGHRKILDELRDRLKAK